MRNQEVKRTQFLIPRIQEDELSLSKGVTQGEKRINVFSIYLSLVSSAHVNSFGCEYVFLTLDSMQKSKKHFSVQHLPQRSLRN